MSLQGFDPHLHVKTPEAYSPPSTSKPLPKMYGGGGGGPSSDHISSAAPEKQSPGLFAKLWENFQWMISELHDLVFSCFGEEKVDDNKDKLEEAQEQIREEWIPLILDKWFAPSLKLGNHIDPKTLIKDLKKFPVPLFEAVGYGFCGERFQDGMKVEDFVNDIVMQEENQAVQESRVLEKLQHLPPEDVAALCTEFFKLQGKESPGPLTIEVFVHQYIMKLKLGLHAGHLIEDLRVLPLDTYSSILRNFFQGIEAPPNYRNLSIDTFVKEHIEEKRGALSRLHAVLILEKR